MMYVAHDAFSAGDLARLLRARGAKGHAHTARGRGARTWATFQPPVCNTHHVTEDTSLWPAALCGPSVTAGDEMAAGSMPWKPNTNRWTRLIEQIDESIALWAPRRPWSSEFDANSRSAFARTHAPTKEDGGVAAGGKRRLGRSRGGRGFGKGTSAGRNGGDPRRRPVPCPWVLDGAPETSPNGQALSVLPQPARVAVPGGCGSRKYRASTHPHLSNPGGGVQIGIELVEDMQWYAERFRGGATAPAGPVAYRMLRLAQPTPTTRWQEAWLRLSQANGLGNRQPQRLAHGRSWGRGVHRHAPLT